MKKIEYIYQAVDDFGLITSSEAKKLGVSNAELVQMARRGKLERVARGVYRMPIWPYQEAAPYAVAVKAAGEGAFLYGESVVALLDLAPTDPAKMWVAVPGRVRRNLGAGVRIVSVGAGAPVTWYEGIASQPVVDALACFAGRMGRERALEATREALRRGYINESQADGLQRGLSV